jgi:hypothetical protein
MPWLITRSNLLVCDRLRSCAAGGDGRPPVMHLVREPADLLPSLRCRLAACILLN